MIHSRNQFQGVSAHACIRAVASQVDTCAAAFAIEGRLSVLTDMHFAAPQFNFTLPYIILNKGSTMWNRVSYLTTFQLLCFFKFKE